MSMKAKKAVVSKRSAQASGDPEHQIDPLEDELVMVLFPKKTWDLVLEMASNSGLTPAEILSMAIEDMHRNAEDAKESV